MLYLIEDILCLQKVKILISEFLNNKEDKILPVNISKNDVGKLENSGRYLLINNISRVNTKMQLNTVNTKMPFCLT